MRGRIGDRDPLKIARTLVEVEKLCCVSMLLSNQHHDLYQPRTSLDRGTGTGSDAVAHHCHAHATETLLLVLRGTVDGTRMRNGRDRNIP